MIYHIILGSNMNNPQQQIETAIQKIGALKSVKILRKSSLAQTKAYGYEDQDDFFNQVLELESSFNPEELLIRIQTIEHVMGRMRSFKWGPRNIDIDILLAGDQVLNYNDLVIPHYDMHNREFTLKLLCELIPEQMHPLLHKTMRELLNDLSSPGGDK
ncbi:MAG: 2-amino-4-hydroxy-6-hydroxymethyldihydropteridine diphosphokinase [Candidatus Cloacimonetes bacterium]|nr:2-amino-4-hydroxy-6-hydroxymethyldihydropteridine diphosphokinase [Candidatus Cloacimonadota bacterium]MDD4667117.1 2-amino-4-hydroxy-6-hydroxymethyldihydropteridine diphosphokinase [Candidatus Cloacimonadota bacterium]MDY0337576.1 2-amino-4-hydroxy-6-hydroxymethyldihydropteridine diphosphokinase [Candidatus Cloacimonadaceae bacterium]HPF08857.1 2-amino-4-hydroxy-6-hydroxymethyldihydropteridine diphosphokinase [Candidatus Cloacimonadota bacterium]